MRSSNFLKEQNARHLWHPMTSPRASESRAPLIIDRGEGVHVWDVDGNRYLDTLGGLWNVNVGHNRPEVKDAIKEQLDRIAYYTIFDGTSNPPAIELSAKLIEMLAPEDMARVFFSSGGSDAIETALKLARQYWKLVGEPQRTKFFSLKNAYHGVHFGGASINGMMPFRHAYEPLLAGCFQIESPWLYRNPWTSDPDELGQIVAGILEREILHQGPDTVAAFIAEPVQGAGGVIVPPRNFWPLVREVCDKYGVLLIADEVVTGFGRTGSMFGARGWGVKPDIMCFAKGINAGYIPFGATAVNSRIASAWDVDGPEGIIMHGYTYSGHPLGCAAALATLAIVEREDLPRNAGTVGAYLLEKLQCLCRFPSVGEVRGLGLMLAIDLVQDKSTRAPVDPAAGFSQHLSEVTRREGVLIRAVGPKIIISPALTFTTEHADHFADVLNTAFQEVDK